MPIPASFTPEELDTVTVKVPESFTPDELERSGKAVDAAKEILTNLTDRRRVLKVLRENEDIREDVLRAAPGVGGQLRKQRGGAVERVGHALGRGVSQMIAQPIMELTGTGGTEEEIESIRQFEGVAAQTFNPATPDDPWYERGPLMAIEMVPWMTTIVRGGGLGKAGAAKSGLASAMARMAGKGRVTMRAGQVAGITAAAFPGQYASELDSLKEAGVEDVWWKKPAAALIASAVGVIEGIVPDPFKAGKVSLTEGALKAGRSYLLGALKKAPGEASEEYLQGLTSGVGRAIATHLDENAPDQGLGQAFSEAWNQGNEALLPLAFMLGTPAVVGAGMQAARAQDLRDMRSKGWITVEEGRKLGLSEEELKNRQTRNAAVDQLIQQKEAEDASQVSSVEEEDGQTEGGQGVRQPGPVEVGTEQESQGPQAPQVPVEETGRPFAGIRAQIGGSLDTGDAVGDAYDRRRGQQILDELLAIVESTGLTKQDVSTLYDNGFAPKDIKGLNQDVLAKFAQTGITRDEVAKWGVDGAEATADLRIAEKESQGAEAQEVPVEKAKGVLQSFEPAAEEAEAAPEFGKDVSRVVGIAATVPITPPRGGVGRSIGNFFQRFFTTRGELPQDVYEAKIRKEGRVAKEMQKLRFAATDFRRGIRKALGGKELTQADVEQMNAVLRGEADMTTVPEEVRAPLQAMRDHIDAMSRALIAEGVAQGDLIGIIDENMGVYATRSYRVFDDPKWRDKVPQDIRNRAWHEISEMYPDKTDAERQGILESLLFRGAAETPARLLKGSKLGAKDLSTFMERQDVPEWLRDLWGEYKDAGVNYARSVFKMSHLLANHQFLNEVREAGTGEWLRTAEDGPAVNEYGEVITKIAADSSSVMEPLNGMYTTPEIKAAFERFDSPGAMPEWLRAMMSVNYAVKYGKTVGSLMTHIRNFISNAGFAVANGHWRLDQAGKAIWATATGTFQLPNAEFRKYYQRLAELGLVGEDVRAGELRDALREASKADIDDFLYNREARHAKKAKKLGRSGVRFLNSLYQAEDGIWKIYAWENEKARYAKAYPEWSETQVEEHAAKIVRDTYPTYSKIPEGVKAVRRFPLVGTFVSFPAEVVRTTFNTAKLGLQESKDPRTRAIGAQRIAGSIAALGGLSVLSRGMMAMFGISDEEDEDLRWFVPPWQENSRFIYTDEPEDATYRFVDMGYSDPHAYLTDAVVAFKRGQNWKAKLWDGMAEFMRPFASEEILAKALMDLRSNEDNKIYNPNDEVGEQAKDMVTHMWTKALEPGTLSSLRRIYTAIAGTDPRKDAKTEVTALLTGQRFQKVDVEHSLGFRVRDFRDALRSIQDIARKTVTSRGTVTGEMIASDRARMERLRLAAFAEMQQIVGAARRLGVPEKNIRNMLKAHLADKVAGEIVTGDYSPYQLTKQSRQRIMDSAPAAFAERMAGWQSGKPSVERQSQ